MGDLKNLSDVELTEQLAVSLSRLADSKEKSDLQQLTHDLQTHQIELEMQNRELRETQIKLEESRNRYADLYDFAPVGYLILDEKGCITEINLCGAMLLGAERAHIINQPMTRWLISESRQEFLAHLAIIFSKEGKAVVELKIKGGKDGSAHDVQLESIVTSDGSNVFCRTAMVDIAERKKYEEQLMLAKDEADAANQAKSQFLANMSHELRTPLNSILGFGQVMKNTVDKTLQPDQFDYVSIIVSSGWHMLAMVNDLLDLAAIDANKIALQLGSVDLSECIQDSLDIILPLAHKEEICIQSALDTFAGIYVLADSDRLKQVLLNLLSNAVKYNHHRGQVMLSCEHTGTDTVRISFADTGPGIAEADMLKLFKPFTQLHNNNYTREGTGIGLAITKQLVERMGGRIGVNSELGCGTTFWIELMMSRSSA